MTDLSLVSAAFQRAAARDFVASPLYVDLAHRIAEDEAILAIARHSTVGQFPPYLLLTAVHRLLLEEPADPLAAFYPSVRRGAGGDGDPYPLFRDFVIGRKAQVISIVSSSHVNKSVLRRAACLRPMIAEAASRAGWPAIHLIDLGCGAGFNLLLDKWRISYEGADNFSTGPGDSPVHLTSQLRKGRPPLEPFPRLLTRTGLDLDSVAPLDDARERWIVAGQFPDDIGNVQSIREASPVLRRDPPRIVIGDASASLKRVLGELPPGEPAIVMHSLTLMHMTPRQRQQTAQAIRHAAVERPLARIGMEISGAQTTLAIALGEGGDICIVGEAEYDGAWLSWTGG